MITVEIASYPKSGNTWVRRLTEDYLSQLAGIDMHPLDIHSDSKLVKGRENAKFLPNVNNDIFIYKSHIHNHPKIKPDKIIHIYRHPLDVFCSAINYLNNHSNKMSLVRKNLIFRKGIPKSVEDIFTDGEMDYYFDAFFDEAGSNYWPDMLDSNSNYFKYTRKALSSDITKSIKYEDLVNDTKKVVNETMNAIFDLAENIDIDTYTVDEKTKANRKTGFYWKAKPKVYTEFLTKEQVERFESKYFQEMKFLGY
ncbi:MAG: hypothetical protein ACI8Q1_002105 [Parvicella sp.]|jgi:hypothetical protein